MAHATYMDFGPLVLRKLIRHSRIFDLWRGERRNPEAGQACLIRRMLPPYTQGESFVRGFLERCQEARAAHITGLLAVIDHGDVDGIPYAVLEGIRGWTLRELLHFAADNDRTVPLEVALDLVTPVARTLATLHAQPQRPMIHGALQPESIWVSHLAGIHLGDLEVGTLAEIELTSVEGQHERAWRFQAPERAEDWAQPAPAVDVFSIGAILLELVAQNRVSMVQSKLEALEQLPLLRKAGLPDALLELIAACQDEDPEARPTMAEVVQRLEVVSAAVPRALSLPDWLRTNAPPIEELDPLAKAPSPDADRFIRKQPRRKKGESLIKEAAGPELPAQSSRWTPQQRLRAVVIATLALLLAGVSAVVFREQLRELALGPGGNMTLLEVVSVPDGATVTLPDGTVLGKTPLRRPTRVNPDGSVAVTLQLDGYASQKAVKSDAQRGGETKVSVRLEPWVDGPSTVHVETVPAGARVTIDGKYRGKSPLDVGELFSKDDHRLELALAGYQNVSRSFRVTPEHVTELSIGLERRKASAHAAEAGAANKGAAHASAEADRPTDPGLPADYTGPVGYLILKSNPWAHIKIDGTPRGATGTGERVRVPVGKHMLKLKSWDKGDEVSHQITVHKDETRILYYDFINKGWRIDEYRPF